MIPIQKLLSRIRWDRAFAKGSFTLAYYDRVEKIVISVPFEKIFFDDDDHFAFQMVDDEGESLSIPYHRVREVYKDGKLIWHREG